MRRLAKDAFFFSLANYYHQISMRSELAECLFSFSAPQGIAIILLTSAKWSATDATAFLLFKTRGGQSGQGHFGQNDFWLVKWAHYNYKYYIYIIVEVF